MTGILKMMDLSTSHITREAATYLNEQAQTNTIRTIIVYEKAEYGWFIWVPDSNEIPDTGFPSLNLLFKEASERHCNWIMLDIDGEEWPDIPQYEW
jgi:hypothetical protein